MKKNILPYLVFLSIAAILSAVNVSAGDLYLNQPLASGVYATENGGIIAQSGCVVNSDANVILIADHFSFQPGFQVPAGTSLKTIFADYDGMDDTWEVEYFDNLGAIPGSDSDGDGLTNIQEFTIGSDPTGLNPDNDNDGLTDAWEIEHFTNLVEQPEGDPDGDGLTNVQEFTIDSDPTVSNPDNDNDGLTDTWEIEYFAGLTEQPESDPDGDGLTNIQEFTIDSDPAVWNPDNDNDGLTDAWELQYFGNLSNPGSEDMDGDGVINAIEEHLGADPTQNDLHGPGVYYKYDSFGRIKAIYRIPAP